MKTIIKLLLGISIVIGVASCMEDPVENEITIEQPESTGYDDGHDDGYNDGYDDGSADGYE